MSFIPVGYVFVSFLDLFNSYFKDADQPLCTGGCVSSRNDNLRIQVGYRNIDPMDNNSNRNLTWTIKTTHNNALFDKFRKYTLN